MASVWVAILTKEVAVKLRNMISLASTCLPEKKRGTEDSKEITKDGFCLRYYLLTRIMSRKIKSKRSVKSLMMNTVQIATRYVNGFS